MNHVPGNLRLWELVAPILAQSIRHFFVAAIAQAGSGLMADPDFWNDVRVSAREFIFGYVGASWSAFLSGS